MHQVGTTSTKSSLARTFRELQHLRGGDRVNEGPQSLHPLSLPPLRDVCGHELGKTVKWKYLTFKFKLM